jgi:hypothetical protein
VTTAGEEGGTGERIKPIGRTALIDEQADQVGDFTVGLAGDAAAPPAAPARPSTQRVDVSPFSSPAGGWRDLITYHWNCA